MVGPRSPHPAPAVRAALFRRSGLTALDLARYLAAVERWILPHLIDRPLTLVQCPGGVSETGGSRPEDHGCRYLQHGRLPIAPDVPRLEVMTKGKGMREYLTASTLAHLVQLAEARVIELHTLNWRSRDAERPDRLVFDLDAGPGVDWRAIVAAARGVRDALAAIGLRSWAKTTGGSGLHVVVPIRPEHPAEVCFAFSRDVATVIARAQPERFTTALAKERRGGRILIDYLRNKRTDSSVAAFSPRARLGAPVSVPVSWDETGDLDPSTFTVSSVPARLRSLRSDPWSGYWRSRQRLGDDAIRALRAAARAAGSAGGSDDGRRPRSA